MMIPSRQMENIEKFTEKRRSIFTCSETTYKYLWKLKETISLVLSAFPVERIELFNGEKKQVSEDVFEI